MTNSPSPVAVYQTQVSTYVKMNDNTVIPLQHRSVDSQIVGYAVVIVDECEGNMAKTIEQVRRRFPNVPGLEIDQACDLARCLVNSGF